MKIAKASACINTLFSVLLVILSAWANAQEQEQASTRASFVHPGILLDRNQLNLIKERVASAREPQSEAFMTMTQGPFATVDYTPTPWQTVECGSSSNPNRGCTDETNDAKAAYAQALRWVITGDERYARNAVKIMDAWSAMLTGGHTNSNAPLQASWAAELFTTAAEIVRYTYPNWAPDKVLQFERMLTTQYLPAIRKTPPCYNGNWEATAIESMINIGVFTNNSALYDEGVAMWRKRVPAYFYLKSDGDLPAKTPGCSQNQTQQIAYWQNLTQFEDGVSQETCRDLDHVAYGMAALINSAETARIQGLDLYGEGRERLTKAMEFHAHYMNGAPVPRWLCGGTLKGGMRGTMEIGLNHYHNRMGLDLPETSRWVPTKRPTPGQFHYFWETLTHGVMPVRVNAPLEIKAVLGWWSRTAYFVLSDYRIARSVDRKILSNGPVEATEENWKGLVPYVKHILAGFSFGTTEYIFLDDGRFIEYNYAWMKPLANPRPVDETTWPGLAPYAKNINGVVLSVTNPYKVHFLLKDGRYVNYFMDVKKTGAPATINNYNWPGVGDYNQQIVGAAKYDNEFADIFLSGRRFIRYNLKTDRAEPGYPKPLGNPEWAGLLPTEKEPERKVLLVGIDGAQYERIQALDLPNFKRLSMKPAYIGGITDEQSQSSTVSGPGWATLLTGVWVNKHGITANSSGLANPDYPSLFRTIREAKPDAYISSIINWPNITLNYFKNDVKENDVVKESLSDQNVTHEAVKVLTETPADFTFLQLSGPDSTGHSKGFGPEYDVSLSTADRQLGELLDAVEKRQSATQDWLVLVSTDHGRSPKGNPPGFDHGAQTREEKTVFIGSNKPLNDEFNDVVKPVENNQFYGIYGLPAATSIAPTIMRHLRLQEDLRHRYDGIPLNGSVGIQKLLFSRTPGADVRWSKPLSGNIIIQRNGVQIAVVPANQLHWSDPNGWQSGADYTFLYNGTAVSMRGKKP